MSAACGSATEVERWGIFEVELAGPSDDSPFAQVGLSAQFQYRNRVVEVDGFYDGQGVFRIRFMPDQLGSWRFTTRSNVASLDGQQGELRCVQPSSTNHGPVRVDQSHFRYADGTRYVPFGTTCYHWTHWMDTEHERETLRSLAHSPFNKVRMCVLPTSGMTPPRIAFEGETPGNLDKTTFNPEFFAHFEQRLGELRDLGIEADVILFHPYDRGYWGVDNMTRSEDLHFLRYVIARLGAYRNIWWSISNEYDFNNAKTIDDWDHLLRFVQHTDPYQHLRSIHNGTTMYTTAALYDFSKPWITHQSIQHWDAKLTSQWRATWSKPVVIDEIAYEGNIARRWGNITGRDMTRRFWEAIVRGGYVTHGECFTDTETGPWISKGGRLYGDSPRRIEFLRQIIADAPDDLIEARRQGTYLLEYFGDRQPGYQEVSLPGDGGYRIDVIDTWNMTTTRLDGTYHGTVTVELPRRTDMALRIERVNR